MGKRSDYKKMDEIANNDIDAGCRKIVNTSTPARRRLRDRLRRQARRRIEHECETRERTDQEKF